MRQILWFEQAQADLEEIYTFYFPESPTSAVQIYNFILEEAERLRSFPTIGMREPSFSNNVYNHTIRSLVIYNGLFKIIYLYKDENIFILRIWCCRKNPKTLKI